MILMNTYTGPCIIYQVDTLDNVACKMLNICLGANQVIILFNQLCPCNISLIGGKMDQGIGFLPSVRKIII